MIKWMQPRRQMLMLSSSEQTMESAMETVEISADACDDTMNECKGRNYRVIRDVISDIMDDVIDNIMDDVIDSIISDIMDDVIDSIISDIMDDVIDSIISDIMDDVIDSIISDIMDDVIDSIITSSVTSLMMSSKWGWMGGRAGRSMLKLECTSSQPAAIHYHSTVQLTDLTVGLMKSLHSRHALSGYRIVGHFNKVLWGHSLEIRKPI